jgi:hypothetical protein
MAFRDDSEALRARIGILERELADAVERAERAEAKLGGLDRAERRVRELEADLASHRAKATPAAPPPLPPVGVETPARPGWNPRTIVGATFVALLGISAIAAFAYAEFSPPYGDTPTHGMVSLDLHPTPPELGAHVAGTLDAEVFDESCRGYVPREPLLVLRTRHPGSLDVAVRSTIDTVLVLVTADGEILCDDDSAGALNPQLRTTLPAGDHRLWVGTYHENSRADVHLAISSSTASSYVPIE